MFAVGDGCPLSSELPDSLLGGCIDMACGDVAVVLSLNGCALNGDLDGKAALTELGLLLAEPTELSLLLRGLVGIFIDSDMM